MKRIQQAQSLFTDGYLCSQSILITFAPQFGLEPDTAAKLGAPFGGGIARRGETCGAVSGAFMVLGLKYGHVSSQDLDSKEVVYRKVEEFIGKFEGRHGSIRCSELLECDISSPQGLQSAQEQQLFTTRCPKFVGDAAEILDEIVGSSQESLQT